MIAWLIVRAVTWPLRAARAAVGMGALFALHLYARLHTDAAARRAGVDPYAGDRAETVSPRG